jgi:hypothetical protein
MATKSSSTKGRKDRRPELSNAPAVKPRSARPSSTAAATPSDKASMIETSTSGCRATNRATILGSRLAVTDGRPASATRPRRAAR